MIEEIEDDKLLQKFEQIADRLSDKGYAIVDNFLEPEEVHNLLEVLQHHQEQGTFKKAGIGTADQFTVDKQVRGDFIRWIEPSEALPPTQIFLDRMNEVMRYINRTCFLGLKDFEFHFTVYPPGTVYQRHLDQFQTNDHRRLSFICYLNEDWKPENGGNLRLYLPNEDGTEEEVDILPIAGRLACFRADLIPHEVLAANRHRYSLTGWMLDQLNELTFL
ncbi:2OG-Fe(II) oxygenase [Pontibacter cellulosilyticus]|uniref:2OG-Fe(II) oxygenase n=1 Tax=Pontibacter cellulosilyticus TaxID=1720253 RepID=A0A923N825_9BACT|nr:2OG-Fe(II) oxygenase [Pontibacter cellulosilyticus]MBC5993919.1 2OG-Fe(II) oxygenase [Pontibacter cellulosilyticus]